MHLVAGGDQTAAMIGGQRFVVNLMSRPGRPVEVRSCEIMGAQHRNRFTFPVKVAVEDVFVDVLASGVRQCLSSLSHTTEVVSLPTLVIELPGLTLAKAHLMTTLGEDGSLAIILRFKTVLGGITRAFQSNLGIEDSVMDHTTHMSALVLTDIVMPLLDLCSIIETGEVEDPVAFYAFMDTLIERARDVRFQAELIKRFVATAGAPDAGPRRDVAARPRIGLVTP